MRVMSKKTLHIGDKSIEIDSDESVSVNKVFGSVSGLLFDDSNQEMSFSIGSATFFAPFEKSAWDVLYDSFLNETPIEVEFEIQAV